MIAIGVFFGGPEQKGTKIDLALRDATRILISHRGRWIGKDDFGPAAAVPEEGSYFEVGTEPAVNVAFYIPGTIMKYEDVGNQSRVTRFSRKQQLVLVAVPVSRDLIDSEKAGDFVVKSVRDACCIAAEAFSKKGIDTFDLVQAYHLTDCIANSLQESS